MRLTAFSVQSGIEKWAVYRVELEYAAEQKTWENKKGRGKRKGPPDEITLRALLC